MDQIDVGVIGVGSMGASHVRVYSSLPHRCTLRGVFDLDFETSRRIAATYNTVAFDRLDDLIMAVDAVSIAVPTSEHFDTACAAIDAGKHVLLEKPIAQNSEQARVLIARARNRGVTLQVGHIERFNPAVQLLQAVLAGKHIVGFEFRRLSPYSPRISDADVVSDLMIHDIDLLHSLLGSLPVRIAAAGVSPISKGRADHAVALFTFAGGVIAQLTASRLTEQKIRSLCITTLDAFIELDFLERRILITSATHVNFPDNGASYRQENVVQKVYVPNHEPLALELESFLNCVRTGVAPVVTGEEALTALELVEAIQTDLYRDLAGD